jgi:sortase B
LAKTAEKAWNMVRRILKQYFIKTRRLVFAALFMMFLIAGLIAAVHIAYVQIRYMQARQEYDSLRQHTPVTVLPSSSSFGQPLDIATTEDSKPLPDLSAMNPDYIGWICIEGTEIDYPVVRGQDNERYLSTTFTGEKNPSGTIFMDYRCIEEFDCYATILYGHNMQDGSMFSGLSRYLDNGYLEQHSEVLVVTTDGDKQIYRILAVQVTDVNDTAYTLFDQVQDQNANKGYLSPVGISAHTEQLLILSTCTDSGNKNKRLLVLAAREDAKE